MGYTMEGKKVVIWTKKVFISDKWPFHTEGENHTFFYDNLRSTHEFLTCLARIPVEEKEKLVAETLGISVGKFVLRSRDSHYKNVYASKKKTL